MKLYEIAHEIQQFIQVMLEVAEENDGVLPVDAEDVLYKLEMDFDKKIESLACVIKNTNAQIEAIKAEEEKLYKRRKSHEKQVDFLKKYLADYVNDPVEFSTCKISFRKSQSVEITGEIDRRFCSVKEVVNPDKKAIKEAIEAGQQVDGAEIVENRNVVIK